MYASVISSLDFNGRTDDDLALVGIIQIALGIAKWGNIGEYFPGAVVKGILAGIGLIIIIQQLPNIIGFDYWHTHTRIHFGIIGIGLVSFMLLFGWDKLKTRYALCKLLPGGY